MTMNVTQLRNELAQQLPAVHTVNRLLCHLLDCPLEHLYACPERQISQTAEKELHRLIKRLRDGMPIEYATGCCEFFSLKLKMSPDALIPRHETELLAEFAIREVPANAACLELGTGSGAIAIALAKHRPDLNVTATDLSETALELAFENIAQHQLTNVQLVQSDWFEALAQRRFQCIISNPPYVAEHDPDLAPQVAAYEPHSALFAGPSGFEQLERIIAEAPAHLAENGSGQLGKKRMLVLEHGNRQQDRVSRCMEAAGFGEIRRMNDDAGLPRFVVGYY